MKIKFISPIGLTSPLLFETMVGSLIANSHEIVEDVKEAMVVFFDLHSRQGKYDWMDLCYVVDKKIPVIFFDFWDYGGTKDEWSNWIGKDNWAEVKKYQPTHDWANFIDLVLKNNIPFIFFVRKMDKTEDYTQYHAYSIEMIMYPDHIFEPVGSDELFNRPYDIFFAGNESPTRRSVYEGLKDTGLKINWTWTNETGKIPHDEWINKAKQSKLFLSADGGGWSDERIYQLGYVGAILKQKNNQFVLRDFTQGFNCLKVSETPLQKEIDFIRMVIQNKERLHSIYMGGIKNIEKFYSPSFRNSYILQVLYTNNIN